MMESGGLSRNVNYSTSGIIRIQISSTTGDNGYHVNLGEEVPGFTYKNSDPEMWMRHSGSRIGDVTTFKADNSLLVLKSLVLCDEKRTAPRVVDPGEVEMGFAGAGEEVTMGCQAEGAPFHEAVWTTPDGGTVGSNDSVLEVTTQVVTSSEWIIHLMPIL